MSKLDPIDRWYSEPLDVHVWSDQPKITQQSLFDELPLSRLEPASNNKGMINPKVMLRLQKEFHAAQGED